MFEIAFLCSYLSLLPLIFTTDSSCIYDVGGGKKLDIRSLGFSNGKGPKYDNIVMTSPLPYTVSWNGCFPYKKSDGGDCNDAAACYTDKRSGVSTRISSQNNVKFEVEPDLYVLVYQTPTDLLTVYLTCAQVDADRINGRQDDAHTFNLYLTSRCCCPGACPYKEPSSDQGISGGTVFIILLLVLSFVYLVGGMLFLRYRRGATGTEMIPHRTIWLNIFACAKDGFQYSYAVIRQRSFQVDYQKV